MNSLESKDQVMFLLPCENCGKYVNHEELTYVKEIKLAYCTECLLLYYSIPEDFIVEDEVNKNERSNVLFKLW